MQRVMQAILGIRTPLAEDEADALAVAVCHLNAPPVSRIASSG
jgi:Holliday junction resolvasome RuvABC endonuclease subunit